MSHIKSEVKNMAKGGKVPAGFKKVYEDEKTAELENEHGHKLKVAKSKLDDGMKAKLAELPLHKQDGGEIMDIDPSQMTDDELNDYEDAKAAMPQPVDVNFNPDPLAIQQGANQLVPPDGMPSFAPTPNHWVPAAPAANGSGPTNIDLGHTTQPQPRQAALPAVDKNLEKQFQQQEALIRRQGEIAQLKATEDVKAAAAHQFAVDELQANYRRNYDDLKNEISNVVADIKQGHINPNQYIDNLGTGGKITTAIGLILSGIGSGMSGQQNLAMQFLDKQIDRNIDAQKVNLGQKNTVLSALYHQMGDLHDATQVYKAMEYENYATKLQEMAAKFGGQDAKRQADLAGKQFHIQYERALSEVANRRALMSSGMRQGVGSNVLASKQIEFGDIPESDRPKAREELKHVQEMQEAKKTVIESLDKIIELRNQGLGKTLGSPMTHYQELHHNEEAFAKALLKISGGRLNRENTKLQKLFAPSMWTTKESQKELRQKVMDMVNSPSAMATPLLDAWDINVDKSDPIPKTKIGTLE